MLLSYRHKDDKFQENNIKGVPMKINALQVNTSCSLHLRQQLSLSYANHPCLPCFSRAKDEIIIYIVKTIFNNIHLPNLIIISTVLALRVISTSPISAGNAFPQAVVHQVLTAMMTIRELTRTSLD